MFKMKTNKQTSVCTSVCVGAFVYSACQVRTSRSYIRLCSLKIIHSSYRWTSWYRTLRGNILGRFAWLSPTVSGVHKPFVLQKSLLLKLNRQRRHVNFQNDERNNSFWILLVRIMLVNTHSSHRQQRMQGLQATAHILALSRLNYLR